MPLHCRKPDPTPSKNPPCAIAPVLLIPTYLLFVVFQPAGASCTPERTLKGNKATTFTLRGNKATTCSLQPQDRGTRDDVAPSEGRCSNGSYVCLKGCGSEEQRGCVEGPQPPPGQPLLVRSCPFPRWSGQAGCGALCPMGGPVVGVRASIRTGEAIVGSAHEWAGFCNARVEGHRGVETSQGTSAVIKVPSPFGSRMIACARMGFCSRRVS